MALLNRSQQRHFQCLQIILRRSPKAVFESPRRSFGSDKFLGQPLADLIAGPCCTIPRTSDQAPVPAVQGLFSYSYRVRRIEPETRKFNPQNFTVGAVFAPSLASKFGLGWKPAIPAQMLLGNWRMKVL